MLTESAVPALNVMTKIPKYLGNPHWDEIKNNSMQTIDDKSDLSSEPISPNPNKTIFLCSAAKVNVQE